MTRNLPQNCTISLPPVNEYALEKRPALLVLAMRVIAAWSRIEAGIATLLIPMVGSRAKSSTGALYASLLTHTSHLNAMRAVAADEMPETLNELFNALLEISRELSKERARVAHGVWALSPELPDAVVVIPLRTAYNIDLELAGAPVVKDGEGRETRSTTLDSIPFKGAMVYDEARFVEVIASLERFIGHLTSFHPLLAAAKAGVPATDPEFAQRYTRLCSEPEVEKALARLRRDRKTCPEEQPPQHPESLPTQ